MAFPEIGWHNLTCEIFLEDTFSGQDKYNRTILSEPQPVTQYSAIWEIIS